MRYASLALLAVLASFPSVPTSARPLEPFDEAEASGFSDGHGLHRRQCDICGVVSGGANAPYDSNISPYNPFANGDIPIAPAPSPGGRSGGGGASGSSSGGGNNEHPHTGLVQNHTFSVTESAWKVTRPVEGYQQGSAEFDNPLPEAYAFLKQVWYSNNPQAFALFTPPVTNVTAMYFVGATKSDRGTFTFALRDPTTGQLPFRHSVSAYSATVDDGFHVLYGVEGLDPTTPFQLVVLNGPGSDAYLVVQGAIVTTYTPPIPGTDVYVDEDDTADLVYAVPGVEDAIATLSSGPAPPYSTATAATASPTTSSDTRGSTATVASGSSNAGAVVSSASGAASFSTAWCTLAFSSALVVAMRG